VRCGTWLFIVGSCAFVAAGALPLVNAKLREHVVVHGTVRFRRERRKLRTLGTAIAAVSRFRPPV